MKMIQFTCMMPVLVLVVAIVVALLLGWCAFGSEDRPPDVDDLIDSDPDPDVDPVTRGTRP